MALPLVATEGRVQPSSAANPTLDRAGLRLRYYLTLFVIDSAAIVLGFAIGNVLRFGMVHHEQGLTLAATILPLFWLINVRGYVPEVLDDWRVGIGRSIGTLTVAVAIVLFLAFFLQASKELSRLLTVISFIASCGALICGRAVIGRFSQRSFAGNALGRAMIRDGLSVEAPAGMTIIDAAEIGLEGPVQHPFILDRLARRLAGADQVFVACTPEKRDAWTTALRGSNLQVELLLPELAELGALGARRFAGIPSVLIGSGPMRRRDEIVKRSFDLALVVPILIFLAPLLAIVALAVRLDSPGPVLFVQQRVGRGNRLFRVFKFRSMHTDLCDAAGRLSASRKDSRITRVGRFIRATSIDELPQLFNILRGEMSFVGPRPHAIGSLAGDMLFWEVDHRYHHRHACKPGLTGLAQIRGFRGATHQREDLVNRLRSDLEYMNGWSVLRDLGILFATVRVLIAPDPELSEETSTCGTSPDGPEGGASAVTTDDTHESDERRAFFPI